jgi:hypothetical protein
MSFIKNLFFKASIFGTINLSLNHNVPSASSWKQAVFGSPSRILLLICPIHHFRTTKTESGIKQTVVREK